MKNTGYIIFREYFQNATLCLPKYLFSLDFIYFKALKADIFGSCSIKKIKDFQGTKTKFKYFQGLEIRLPIFKGFQDAYKPCRSIHAPSLIQTPCALVRLQSATIVTIFSFGYFI